MLWNSSAIKGYAVAASDGRLGTVSDFLFDDAGWSIRWLVVETGNWLSGRKVLLPPSALKHPDARGREFSVGLTTQRVKDSPDIDIDQPVSRQMEVGVYDYYGWSPYWGMGLYMGGYGYAGSSLAASSYLELRAAPAGIWRHARYTGRPDAGRRWRSPPSQHRTGCRLPYPCQRWRDRPHQGLSPRRCRLEDSLPCRRYKKLVAWKDGFDLATIGTRY